MHSFICDMRSEWNTLVRSTAWPPTASLALALAGAGAGAAAGAGFDSPRRKSRKFWAGIR